MACAHQWVSTEFDADRDVEFRAFCVHCETRFVYQKVETNEPGKIGLRLSFSRPDGTPVTQEVVNEVLAFLQGKGHNFNYTTREVYESEP